MANQVALSAESIVDIQNDTPSYSTGTIIRVGSTLQIGAESAVGYTYQYQPNEEGLSLSTDNLVIDLKLTDGNNLGNSRYNNRVEALVIVQYYKEVLTNGTVTGYESGNINQFIIMPYFENESEGIIREYILPLDNKPIQAIYVEFRNTNEELGIEISGVILRYSMSVAQAINQTVGFDVTLERVDFYPNAFKLKYSGTDSDDKFYWNGNQSDELNGINVNNVKLIPINNHSELLP